MSLSGNRSMNFVLKGINLDLDCESIFFREYGVKWVFTAGSSVNFQLSDFFL